MKFLYILITTIILIVVKVNFNKPLGKCTGDEYCTSCSNCKYCGHCSSGGKCGVCAPAGYYKKKKTTVEEHNENGQNEQIKHETSNKSFENKYTTIDVKSDLDSNVIKSLSNQKKKYDSINKANENQSSLYIDTKNSENSDEVFTLVEEMAEFNGGAMAMMKYIQKNLKAPNNKPKVTGKCFAKFIVRTDGSISDITIIKPVPNCEECSDEVIKLLSEMPKWKPAKQNGRPVPVYYNLPINFNFQ